MRISDWSSDVCSSDLTPAPPRSPRWHRASFPAPVGAPLERGGAAAVALVDAAFDVFDEAARAFVAGLQREGVVQAAGRSEEHTSELQSLMRTSYAVFCLKNKNTETDLTTDAHP